MRDVPLFHLGARERYYGRKRERERERQGESGIVSEGESGEGGRDWRKDTDTPEL